MTTTIRFESTGPLAISQVPDEPYTWETTAPLVFHGSTRIVEVPVRSRFDGASVPPLFAWLIDPREGAAAALVHDYCYRVLIPVGEMTYQEADQLLSEALWALKVPDVSRLLVWDAVRIASVASRPGGRIGMQRDLPMMAAIAVPGAMMAAASVVLLAPMGALKALNWLAGRSNRVLRVLARLDVMGRELPAWQSRSTNQPTTLAKRRRSMSSR